ncbi:hypothetical protein VKT23_010125 [Stygiomarasmius scandens]|uniref:Beta-xylanase n=1 Tax=Marasmiellus scandens TaxID=2682957 RepID=A0ABR1JC46_9AGAR
MSRNLSDYFTIISTVALHIQINDYNIEAPNAAKTLAMVNLVKDLKNRGIPIDGVGIQGHLIVGALPAGIQTTLENFAALGVEVAFTELDIRMNLPATQAQLNQQQKDYQTVAAACRNVSKCVGMTTWGFTDAHSWIPGTNFLSTSFSNLLTRKKGTFSGTGAALPWDQNYNKKPAYNGIIAGLQ